MTEERKELINRFQKWLDTNPRKQLIAAQCATIAEKYLVEQSSIAVVSKSFTVKQIVELLEEEETLDDAKQFFKLLV